MPDHDATVTDVQALQDGAHHTGVCDVCGLKKTLLVTGWCASCTGNYALHHPVAVVPEVVPVMQEPVVPPAVVLPLAEVVLPDGSPESKQAEPLLEPTDAA